MKSRQRVIASVVACLMVCLNVAAQKEGAWDAKKSGWQLLTPTQRTEVFDFAEKYKRIFASQRARSLQHAKSSRWRERMALRISPIHRRPSPALD